MPAEFDKMVKSIKDSFKGKINPRTKKPYTESDAYAIATSTWKKKHGNLPTRNNNDLNDSEEINKLFLDAVKEVVGG
uniref:Uncharacterized protein n=1 Tax=viral metagenome TaxID=1070528 RepID=A0A6M3ISY2_9ZZZZ